MALGLALSGLWLQAAHADTLTGMAGGGIVSPITGSYGDTVKIVTPVYYEVGPQLSLTYSSGGQNGFAGVGWNLSGESFIERCGPDGGTPKYDSSDIFRLDGRCSGILKL